VNKLSIGRAPHAASCNIPARSLSRVLAASALFVIPGHIPAALSNSEGAGSVIALATLSGAHLYIQVLRNLDPDDCVRFRQPTPPNHRTTGNSAQTGPV